MYVIFNDDKKCCYELCKKNILIIFVRLTRLTLFRNKRFLVNLKTEKNASKFAIFIYSNFHFPLMNALVYVDIDPGIYKGKNGSCSKWKTKKTTWVFFLYKYRKFWSISSEFKLEHKSFILEVCAGTILAEC